VRVGIGIAVLLATVFLGIFLFTTITLLVGAWFYERIWASVERRFGAVPDPGTGFWHSLRRDLGDALRMLVPTLLLGAAVFALSLVPVVGTIGSVVLGALAGGWFLTIDLTGFALGARGLRVRERRAAIRSRRAMTVGFGVATYLMFLIPGGTVLGMPAAVAGATLLSRRLLNEPEPLEPARTAS
jgi:CysZ protein